MKLYKCFRLICFGLLLFNMQCDNDDGSPPSLLCDEIVIVSDNQYQTLSSDFYNFVAATVNENCLEVTISSSGCSGETWEMILVDSEGVSESLPPQRDLKFALINNEACLAVFSRTVSFDLTPLEVEGSNEVVLNIEDFPESLVYMY